jgi:DNA-binding CsgD family transcriptional regulator
MAKHVGPDPAYGSNLFASSASQATAVASIAHNVDWSAVATLLAERAGVSGILLGGRGEVLLITPAAERALGWSYRCLGRDWIECCLTSRQADEARWILGRAALGALRRFDVEVITAEGPRLATFESSSVGASEGRGVLLVLEAVGPAQSRELLSDYDYEVRGVASEEFEITELLGLGQGRQQLHGRCHEVLHGRSSPCERCPIRHGADSGVRLVVRARAEREQQEYEVVSAVGIGNDAACVSVRRVDPNAFAAILHAKLAELAERGKLSERERDVLRHLVEGSPIEETAKALSISPRTVKFHQANLLAKLGADSRSDLMRLVL